MSSITQLSQRRRKKRARTRTNTHSHTIWLSVLSIVQWPVVITLSTGPKPIALYTHAPRPGSLSSLHICLLASFLKSSMKAVRAKQKVDNAPSRHKSRARNTCTHVHEHRRMSPPYKPSELLCSSKDDFAAAFAREDLILH